MSLVKEPEARAPQRQEPIAVMIAASIRPVREHGLLGPKMTFVGRAAVPALVISGIAYAGAVTGLMLSAELSLLLLLIWIGYAGVATNRVAH